MCTRSGATRNGVTWRCTTYKQLEQCVDSLLRNADAGVTDSELDAHTVVAPRMIAALECVELHFDREIMTYSSLLSSVEDAHAVVAPRIVAVL
jgi:hypothetical protein